MQEIKKSETEKQKVQKTYTKEKREDNKFTQRTKHTKDNNIKPKNK